MRSLRNWKLRMEIMKAMLFVDVFMMLWTLLLVASIFSRGASEKKVALPDLAVNTCARVTVTKKFEMAKSKKVILIEFVEKQTYGIFRKNLQWLKKR